MKPKLKQLLVLMLLSAFKLVPVSDSYDGDNSLSLMLSKDGTMTAGAYYGLEKVSGVIMNDDYQDLQHQMIGIPMLLSGVKKKYAGI